MLPFFSFLFFFIGKQHTKGRIAKTVISMTQVLTRHYGLFKQKAFVLFLCPWLVCCFSNSILTPDKVSNLSGLYISLSAA